MIGRAAFVSTLFVLSTADRIDPVARLQSAIGKFQPGAALNAVPKSVNVGSSLVLDKMATAVKAVEGANDGETWDAQGFSLFATVAPPVQYATIQAYADALVAQGLPPQLALWIANLCYTLNTQTLGTTANLNALLKTLSSSIPNPTAFFGPFVETALAQMSSLNSTPISITAGAVGSLLEVLIGLTSVIVEAARGLGIGVPETLLANLATIIQETSTIEITAPGI